eukprot:GHVN01019072.1.p1 GENE.GHVN01019072.1~~GHVN01019072.1.p1  ORF type:complete len:486 (-),score=52.18 GHVN01019072.1:740-2197(-)
MGEAEHSPLAIQIIPNLMIPRSMKMSLTSQSVESMASESERNMVKSFLAEKEHEAQATEAESRESTRIVTNEIRKRNPTASHSTVTDEAREVLDGARGTMIKGVDDQGRFVVSVDKGNEQIDHLNEFLETDMYEREIKSTPANRHLKGALPRDMEPPGDGVPRVASDSVSRDSIGYWSNKQNDNEKPWEARDWASQLARGKDLPHLRRATSVEVQWQLAQWKEKVLGCSEVTQGAIEEQEEGEQLLALSIQRYCRPWDKVLEINSSGPGKACIYARDLKSYINLMYSDEVLSEGKLAHCRQSLKMAGVMYHDDGIAMKGKIFDVVVVDAPSTRCGSYRRFPELKWLFSEDLLWACVGLQRQLMSEALLYMKPKRKLKPKARARRRMLAYIERQISNTEHEDEVTVRTCHGEFINEKEKSRIIYVTNSFLREETTDQVEYFCKTHDLCLLEEPTTWLPQPDGGHDGYFFAVMEKRLPHAKPLWKTF